ncbi:hypothetical protein BFW01_g968 [Lasiodiplodia theobromae]|uniref:Uncharacterized protein n=1 Tax=Lasiodiplodia theobromae TaxID=45133 RepID=A0A8H7IRI4_9PEZI|nr:hypothetical protein BFW01_g968 [Lasiodiplodia theobromae]
MAPPAQSARPTSWFGGSSLLSPLSAAAPAPTQSCNASSNRSSSPQHLEPPQSGMNRLSLDSALMRKNPFARANASNLSISTENQDDIEPGLKSAPPVPERHSATFPLADRLLSSFMSSKEDLDTPAVAGVGCEVSDDEMQALLEHVRRSENERARAEHELQRREKELARVKNELRKAEREIEDLKAQLRRHEQHRGALDGTLKPDDLGVLPPAGGGISRHDSLDPNHRHRRANSSNGSNTSTPTVPEHAGESPYYISGGDGYGASSSTMDLSPTSAAAYTFNTTPSVRPLSCIAAPLSTRFGNGSSPRLQTQPSMTSISETHPGYVNEYGEEAVEDHQSYHSRPSLHQQRSTPRSSLQLNRPQQQHETPRRPSIQYETPRRPSVQLQHETPQPRTSLQLQLEQPYQPQPYYEYQYPDPDRTASYASPDSRKNSAVAVVSEQYEQPMMNPDIAAAAAALEGYGPPPAAFAEEPEPASPAGGKGHHSGRRFLRSRHGKEKGSGAGAERPKSSYAGAGIKEKKSAGRLREKFSRMSLFGGKRDDGAPSSPVPAVPALEA